MAAPRDPESRAPDSVRCASCHLLYVPGAAPGAAVCPGCGSPTWIACAIALRREAPSRKFGAGTASTGV